MRLFFLFFWLLQMLPFCICAQREPITFDHLTSAQGLSHGIVTCIIQDKEGFMWFGTKAGLNRYDGHSFQVYEHDPASKNSLNDNTIRSICEDRTGMLWIGTTHGLNQFDKRTNTFRQFNLATPQHSSNNAIWSVYEDRSGTIWIGTSSGLNKFDKATSTVTLFAHDSLRDAWAYNAIQTIYEDRAGNMWVGTNQGFSRFDRKTGQFTRFSPAERILDSLAFPNAANTIYEDRSGVLWVGTRGNGLQQFDRRTHTFQTYRYDAAHVHSLSDNSVLSLCEDSFGTLWVATGRGGLNRLERSTGQFTHYLPEPANAQSISNNSLICLYEDRFKVLWVGTYARGINKVDLLRKRFAHFKHESTVESSLLDDYVYALFSDRTGAIWVGNRKGLSKLDRKSGTFTHYPYTHHSSQYSATDVTYCLYEDRSANLWLGLAGGGLRKFDSKRQKFTSYVHNPADSNSLAHNVVKAILEDSQGTLWIGTQNGLCRLDAMSGRFTTYKPSPIQGLHINSLWEEQPGILWLATDKDGLMRFNSHRNTFVRYYLPGNSPHTANLEANIMCLHQDRSGVLWLSTEAGQFYRFNRKTSKFTLVTLPKELAKTVINGILEDGRGNLWLSTRIKGLIKFNPATQATHHYDVTDGLQSNEFNDRALCNSVTGELYFGGNNGFNVFHPDSIGDNPYAPPVVIRGFKVFDQPRSFTQDPIILSYRDNFFSFDFAALHYALPEKNRYAYRLEGVDKDWIQAGTRHEASYTNLDPGEYVLRVKASNNDGVWNEQGATIHVVIHPPWWRTWWAYLLYGWLVVGLLFILWRYTVSRERMKNNLKLKSLESEKLHELARMKSRFFTNVSHEFRTPLTLIMNPAEELGAEHMEDSQRQAYAGLIRRNAKRLLGLVNQLLDLSKLEAGNMALASTPGDIARFIQGNVSAFASFAESQQASLRFHASPDSIRTSFDADKLEKIMYNLLSNAFKFTPEQGEIAVSVTLQPPTSESDTSPWIEIQVQDTGIGIPAAQLDKIFDRFYQVDNSHTRRFEGTGIGLALTKELVELHGGRIYVTSEPGAGTCFTITVPFTEVNEEWPDVLLDNDRAFTHSSHRRSINARHATYDRPGEQASLLLIVEDNADIRSYLRHTFEVTYRMVEANNGAEGLQIAIDVIPDLIISDWMMPEMDGRTMCARIKTDERTSHIPFILLTAKAAIENKLEGLETGADEYLTKPFHIGELVVRVKNLLQQRKRLRERFSQAFALPPVVASLATEDVSSLASPFIPTPLLVIPAIDEKFLQTFIRLIEAHLSDSELDVGFFEKEMGLNRTQLYRKVKALTDHTPADFIRSFRLKKAAALLPLGQNTVSEVAYQVGFTHLSYFTKCFRKVYGMTPSEYMTHRHDSPSS